LLIQKDRRVRAVFLIAALLLGATLVPSGSGALAQGLCVEPPMPLPVDGAALSADQMRAAMADARNFIAQSGLYQECLTNEVEAAKTQAAAASQPFDPAIETGARAKVEASQKAQEKAGAAANGAMAAYKNAHPPN
jgi:hypothetical protein